MDHTTIEQPQAIISQKELRKNILKMIWPATIEAVLQMMVGIFATAMVGRIGAVAIGAVGLGNRIARIVWTVFQAIGAGATVYVARSVGARDYDTARRIALQALIVGIVFVLVFSTFAFIFAEQILTWFNADGDLYEVAFSYLRLVVWGMPFMAVMQIVGASLRGAGDTRTPMIIAFIMNLINIAVSYTLIFGKFGFQEYGVNGAAYGAIISQAICAALAIAVMYRKNYEMSFRHLKRFEVHFEDIKRILNIGLPVAAQGLFWQFATIILTKWIIGFGTNSLAAHQLGLTAESLSFMPGHGFRIAATTFVGQSLGRKDIALAERYVKEIKRWCIYLCIVTASCLFFFPRWLLGLFTTDLAVIELGRYYLMMMALIQIPQQLQDVMVGAVRGAGVTRLPMLFSFIGIWLIRLPGSYFFGIVLGYGVIGVWLAMMFDIAIRYLLNLWLFNKGEWKYKVLA